MRLLFPHILILLLLQGCIDNIPVSTRYYKNDYWVDNFRNNGFPSKAFNDDKIYCSSLEVGNGRPNFFYCLNLKTGKVDWVSQVDSWASQPPIIKDSFIYYCSYLGGIYKFDKSGNVIWKKKLTGSYSGHTINSANNNLLVNTVETGAYEYDCSNGKIVYQYGKHNLGTTLPVFVNNLVLIGGVNLDTTYNPYGDFIVCYDNKSKKEVWRTGTTEDVRSLYVNKNNLYYINKGSVLNCLDIATGGIIWKSDSLKSYFHSQFLPLYPRLIFVDNTIFCYDVDLNPILKLSNPYGRVLKVLNYNNIFEQELKLSSFTYSFIKDSYRYRILVSNTFCTSNDYEESYDVSVRRNIYR